MVTNWNKISSKITKTEIKLELKIDDSILDIFKYKNVKNIN